MMKSRTITANELAQPETPYAGTGFSPGAIAPADARLLRHHALGLVVDSVEVHSERLSLLPVPTVLAADSKRAWAGALAGFVEAGGLLWPVVSLARLAAPEVAS